MDNLAIPYINTDMSRLLATGMIIKKKKIPRLKVIHTHFTPGVLLLVSASTDLYIKMPENPLCVSTAVRHSPGGYNLFQGVILPPCTVKIWDLSNKGDRISCHVFPTRPTVPGNTAAKDRIEEQN